MLHKNNQICRRYRPRHHEKKISFMLIRQAQPKKAWWDQDTSFSASSLPLLLSLLVLFSTCYVAPKVKCSLL